MTLHGQHLTSLQLSAVSAVAEVILTQLPCPNLRELDLVFMDVQLAASSTQPGVLHSCTRLTKLEFVECRFINSRNSLAALSALVGLQHLQVEYDMDNEEDDQQLPGTVLEHLTHLTYLFLHDIDARMLIRDSLEHLSCLTNLQELQIFCDGVLHPEVRLSPSTTPGLSRLTALQQVTLQGVRLDPTILQDCTQLQRLRLQYLAVISAGGVAALHSLLGCLQQLQSLQLASLEYDQPVAAAAAAAAAAYTSLTASSLLQKLHLTVEELPAGVWPHVFPPDRQLPALRELDMRWGGFIEDETGPPPAATPGTDDLSSIIRCCPGLCRLDISVQPETQLSALAKASCLTSLSVSGLQAEGFESLGALSGPLSLRELYVHLGGPITPRDLLCLTALKGLTCLFLDPLLQFDGDYDVTLDLTQVRVMLGSL